MSDVEDAADVWAAIQVVLVTSVRSVLHAGTLAASGVYMGKTGVMTKEATKAMSTVSMRVTIPALLFSSVLPAVNLPLLSRIWPMLLLPAVYAALGALVGCVVIKICDPPDDFRRGTIAAVAFGNSTGMPIVLLSVISAQLKGWWIRTQHIDVHAAPPAYAAEPLVFLSVYLLTYPIVQWGIGSWLLAPTPAAPTLLAAALEKPPSRAPSFGAGIGMHANASFMDAIAAGESSLSGSFATRSTSSSAASLTAAIITPTATPPLHMSSALQRLQSDKPALREALLPEEHPADMRDADGAPLMFTCADLRVILRRHSVILRRWLGLALKTAATIRRQVLVPPVVAVLLGLLCSSLHPTYFLLCGGVYGERLGAQQCPTNDAYLGWLTSGLAALGKAAVPINLLLTGNALAKGPDWQSLPLKANVGILLGKMVVLPVLAMVVMVVVHRFLGQEGTGAIALQHPWDEPLYVAALAVSATPSANNLMVMVELSGGNRKAMSTAIFTQYAMAPLILPITLTSAILVATKL